MFHKDPIYLFVLEVNGEANEVFMGRLRKYFANYKNV